ncbi:MAG TPA: HAMP domain-containing sensor histidine kinase [Bryobacteraceae bacterium]|nr:HAMP domain-containing sensor histidine kinase [Bryobacteraceae bacterium]
MTWGFSRMSLLWKILLSTSVAITTLLAVTLVIVQRHVVRTTQRTLEEEVNGSFQAYDSLWKARAEELAAVSLVLSKMSDVRAAFRTGDQATIRDVAGEFWPAGSHRPTVFLVADPDGNVIASLGDTSESFLKGRLAVIGPAANRFPQQSSGFMLQDGRLYQAVVTPVYVETAGGPALLDVLVAGYACDAAVAQQFKEATGGSEFAFLSGGRVLVSTLPNGVPSTGEDYAGITRPLSGVDGSPIGELRIYRSFEAASRSVAALLRDVYVIWLAAVVVGLVLTSWLTRKIVAPVHELDRAAGQIANENYDVRVREDTHDELGRLGHTFNMMCAALQSARANLIRQERISTIGRLSSSIIHDLRNPLAAIYGGAEILVDMDLPPAQVKRLASNIYGASGRIREMLTDLAGITRGKIRPVENCKMYDIVAAAYEALAPTASSQQVEVLLDVPDQIELPLERARMERVFFNLIANALEAIPAGGRISITGRQTEDSVTVEVEDNGPGIPPEIRAQLFEPFVTAGKKDGMGLGLALSRQTVLDHGGDMWIEAAVGARFVIRLPFQRR